MRRVTYTLGKGKTCPHCEGHNLKFGESKQKINGGASFPFLCKDCGDEGLVDYKLIYDCMVVYR